MKTNPERRDILEWLEVLESASRGEHYPALFKKVHGLISIPSRQRKAVSIYKLNRYTKEGANVIVPRKILSTGRMDHKVHVTALEYSEGARRALKEAGCSMLSIKEMIGRDKIQVLI